MKHINQTSKRGFRYYFFEHQYPTWLYSIAMGLFALGLYVWIRCFLVIKV